MIAVIINFIKSHWVGTIAGIFVLGIAAKLSLQHIEIDHLHHQLALCRAEDTALANSNKALVRSVETQNAAIDQLQAQADKKSNAVARALADAKAGARKYAVAAERLKTQRATGNECADMQRLMNDYIISARQ